MDTPTRRLKLTGEEIDDIDTVWQASPLDIQIGIFIDDATPEDDFANVSSFQLLICRDRHESTVVATKTVLVSDMDDESITAGDWDDGTAQHVTFELNSADMNILLLDADERMWVMIQTVLSSGSILTNGGGYMIIRESANGGNPGTTGADVYTIVADAGGVEWLKITRSGAPDRYATLTDEIPQPETVVGETIMAPTGETFTMVGDAGDIEWLKITRTGADDRYAALSDSIP